jgi:hypothetical protein
MSRSQSVLSGSLVKYQHPVDKRGIHCIEASGHLRGKHPDQSLNHNTPDKLKSSLWKS